MIIGRVCEHKEGIKSSYLEACELIEEIQHHIAGLEHDCKRYTEVEKEKMAIVKIEPAIKTALSKIKEWRKGAQSE